MLCDYHVDNHGWNFVSLIVFYFAILYLLRTWRYNSHEKIKSCSLAENKPADILLQLKLMLSEN